MRGESAAHYIPELARLGERVLALLRGGLGQYGRKK
jgi:hypothetical protein